MFTNFSFRIDEISRFTYPYVYWDNFFTDLELRGVIDYCQNNQEFEDAKVMPPKSNSDESAEDTVGVLNTEVRKSKVKMFNPNEENSWIFNKIKSVGELINTEFYRFDLIGFNHLQYTEYDEEYKGKYDFHIDISLGADSPLVMQFAQRKLSLVLFLSDSDEYEGGQFEIMTGGNCVTVEQKKGRVIAFPSWVLHRVTPVTKGNRKSLVCWICGPKFR